MKNNNITEGAIWKSLVLFFIPIFLQSVFQQIFSITDAIIVGNAIGKYGLGAINATSNLTKFFMNLFTGISAGAAVIVGQAYGAKEREKIDKSLHTGVAFAIIGSLVMAGICIPSTPFFMKIMSIPEDLLEYSSTYTSIFFFGMIGTFLYDMGAGILRAVGDSKSPFYYLLISLFSNVIMDILFVIFLHGGVRGAAIATAVSQFISAVLVFSKLSHGDFLCRLKLKQIGIDNEIFIDMIKLGLPMGISGVLYSISNIVIQSSVNSLGTDALSSWSVHVKMDSVIWSLYDAVNVSSATFAAQNFGAKKADRVKQGVKWNFIVGGAAVIFCSVIIFLFAEPIAALFIKDKAIISNAVFISKTMAPFYIIYIVGQVFGSTIRGCGETLKPMFIALIGTCGSRVLWVAGVNYFTKPTIGNMALGYIVTWTVYSSMMAIYFFAGNWKNKLKAL